MIIFFPSNGFDLLAYVPTYLLCLDTLQLRCTGKIIFLNNYFLLYKISLILYALITVLYISMHVHTYSNFAYVRLLSKPYENEVTLTGQNTPLKCCQHLEIQYTVRKRVDVLILKVLGLFVKGLQSY